MRRMILQKFITWCESLFPFVHQNGTTTEVGGNLEVDGNINSNAQVFDIVMNSAYFTSNATSPYNKAIIKNGILHIMINDAGILTSITYPNTLATITLPDTILNKIYVTLGGFVCFFYIATQISNTETKLIAVQLNKTSTGLEIIAPGAGGIPANMNSGISGRVTLTI